MSRALQISSLCQTKVNFISVMAEQLMADKKTTHCRAQGATHWWTAMLLWAAPLPCVWPIWWCTMVWLSGRWRPVVPGGGWVMGPGCSSSGMRRSFVGATVWMVSSFTGEIRDILSRGGQKYFAAIKTLAYCTTLSVGEWDIVSQWWNVLCCVYAVTITI